ncbi:MAG: arginine--tRNA ligase [Firmicutes bacterium]|nr:arginine--tRNA ligase [Bacillota bacterium]
MGVAEEVKGKLTEGIAAALNRAMSAGELEFAEIPEFVIEVPKEREHGDFATNVAMLLSRYTKLPPRKNAEIIVNYLQLDDLVERTDVAGPGFINFHLKKSWLYQVLTQVEAQDDKYGWRDLGRGERVQIEFVSANPVGPMNVVNARAAAVGDTLARLLRALGYDVTKEYYVNDAGNQARIFGKSIAARYLQQKGQDVPFPEDGYPADYVIDLAKTLLTEHPELDQLPLEELQQFCTRWGTDHMVEGQKRDLAEFGVEFDVWFRERELHEAKAVEKVIEVLGEKGLLYESEGAIWFRSTQFGDDKDRVLVKSDGNPTYLTPDIAYHWNKYQRGFDKVIDILGPDHHGYVGRMKAAVQALGYSEDSLEIIILQLVNLLRDGEKVRMSKRRGEFVTMDELISEVGKDAARYFFLMRSPESHLDFDLSLAVEQSSDNPVYYVQYAHARICSILRQAEEQEVQARPYPGIDQLRFEEDVELELLRRLADFSEEIELAGTRREPHRIARYVHEVASLFHNFYTHCRVLGVEPEIQASRLALADAVRVVLRNGLYLLGIDAPERM